MIVCDRCGIEVQREDHYNIYGSDLCYQCKEDVRSNAIDFIKKGKPESKP